MSEVMQYLAKIGIDDSTFNPTLENMSKAMLNFTNAATIGFAAVAAGAIMATERLRGLAKSADELEELSGAIGVSVDELQKFQYAAALAGEASNAYDGMLTKLTISMAKSRDATSEQAEAFAKLGVNPEGKTTSQVFLEVARAMEKMDDTVARAELSMTLYGKSWVEASKLQNDYLENADKIDKSMRLSTQDIADLKKMNDQWNATLADGNNILDITVVNLYRVTEALSVQKNMVFDALEMWDKFNNQEKLPNDPKLNKTDKANRTLADDQALIDQVNGENKKALAMELTALNQEFGKGKMSVADYNKERLRITGQASALAAPPGGDDNPYANNDQATPGQASGKQWATVGYLAPGVTSSMGVNAAPSAPNSYQERVAAGLYQKYFDQLTGDRWGPQMYREDIARQLAVNEAVGGYKSQEEAWAASGYKPNSNITIVQYNSGNATPAEIANATAESVDRLLAGG